MRWLSLLFLLLVDLVPLDGMLRLGWSAMVVVALFWIEIAMNVPFTCARLILHRRLAAGFAARQDERSPWGKESRLLRDYAFAAFLQVFFMGIFMALLLAFCLVVLADQHPDWEDDRLFSVAHLVQSAKSMGVAIVLGFLFDAVSMRRRSYAWIEAQVAVQSDRSVSLFFGLIFGVFAMIATQSPLAVAYVLLALKTGADIYRWHFLEKADRSNSERSAAQPEPVAIAKTG